MYRAIGWEEHFHQTALKGCRIFGLTESFLNAIAVGGSVAGGLT